MSSPRSQSILQARRNESHSNSLALQLTDGEARNMLDFFRLRLIQLFIGEHDRENNKLQSHMHAVCDFLASTKGLHATHGLDMSNAL
jgi:hypothetical protein